ncbi:DJ-1/PfpI family protein [Variovorax sp. J22P271]|uniref:GlxA family transcriptional regulator n=1 Tax=Variovorax davisae TaxID=3053515 RepID=UPI00257802DE|nr:DJ-1/PfpI family protein [Variovorax sp. J22P271]MDM0032024.1 DJ-1/PfpI family protein [Variovorax sp. J22P271]
MTRTVALLVFSGVQSLDVSGPLDVFAEANRFLATEDHYLIEVIGVERGLVACSNGLPVQAHRHYSEALDAYDLLLVAGGPALVHQKFHPDLYAWLKAASVRAKNHGSICSGAFILARAGLLHGRTVTTHWNDAAALARLCPMARVDSNRLYTQDGALYTSAGVTAGIDLSLYILGQHHGVEVALQVARRLVVFTQRAGGQSQFSPFLTPPVEADSPLMLTKMHVLAHLRDDLTVGTLAKVANMSERTFARIFARDTQVTPAEFVESARLDAARVMLETSQAPLKTVAYQCGFKDAHRMRAVFMRRLDVSPQQYRLNFGSAGKREG